MRCAPEAFSTERALCESARSPSRICDVFAAGCLKGLEHTADLVAKQRQSFTEQTQEDLYMSTHAGKSASKKGLGSSTAPRVPLCLPHVSAWPFPNTA